MQRRWHGSMLRTRWRHQWAWIHTRAEAVAMARRRAGPQQNPNCQRAHSPLDGQRALDDAPKHHPQGPQHSLVLFICHARRCCLLCLPLRLGCCCCIRRRRQLRGGLLLGPVVLWQWRGSCCIKDGLNAATAQRCGSGTCGHYLILPTAAELQCRRLQRGRKGNRDMHA